MKTFTIERTINAPIEKVWEAFTTPALMKQWWSPEGMDASSFDGEIKEAGRFRYCHKLVDGSVEFWGRGEIVALNAPTHFSYKDCFTDEEGNDVPSSYYGMTDSRSGEITEVLVEFFFTQKGQQTNLRMVQENPFDDQMASDMTDGWNQMFNKLGNKLK